ncbi:hypothetical protein BS50DRAFT_487014 [Corynespora cassiicola Philippines]|uniref:Ricin B lectin domain-containing protein n=1 Tax=Corynespora cassiicola Philippines TaxID=1448308 RepID=A0A2T2P0R6_CORCC|nr:hypothetical protein BS50DRAFT_487014 [Corynespora cassiicola Philippines]
MSDYSGPGVYEIVPFHANGMSLNVWGGGKSAGTQVKLYQRSPNSQNAQFEIVAAGGTQAHPENGDREYHIIAVHSGLYIAANVTTELRSPLDASIRWKLTRVGNGAFYNAGAKKQLNVRGAGKDAGTELITYDFAEASNSQFFLKLV